MKNCIACGEPKAICEFYAHPQMADGHLNKCKECQKAHVKANYAKRRAQYSAYDRRRQQEPQRRLAKQVYLARHRKVHPEKDAARSAVQHALRSGQLKRQPCRVCGHPKAQAHHSNYGRPLDVDWLCFKCHREGEHGQTVSSDFR